MAADTAGWTSCAPDASVRSCTASVARGHGCFSTSMFSGSSAVWAYQGSRTCRGDALRNGNGIYTHV